MLDLMQNVRNNTHKDQDKDSKNKMTLGDKLKFSTLNQRQR